MRHNFTPVKTRKEPLAISNEFEFLLATGEIARLEKEVVVVTSRDVTEEKQISHAQTLLQSFGTDFSALKAEHEKAWHKRWHSLMSLLKATKQLNKGFALIYSSFFFYLLW